MISQEVAGRDRRQLGIPLDQSGTLRPLPYPRCTNENDSSRLAELLDHMPGGHRWLAEETEVRRKRLLLVLEGTAVEASVLATHARHHDHRVGNRQEALSKSKQTGLGSNSLQSVDRN